MTRFAIRHQAVNLAQGFPDFPAPDVLKQAAADALFADVNQYAITWGAKRMRDAVADKVRRFNRVEVDPDREVTVVCGSTEGMVATLLGIINPGDEVVIFEPFYENYGPDTIISGATPRYVELRRPDWSFDPDELRRAFNERTKAIVINTPNNPARSSRRPSSRRLPRCATSGMRWPSPTRFTSTSSMTARRTRR